MGRENGGDVIGVSDTGPRDVTLRDVTPDGNTQREGVEPHGDYNSQQPLRAQRAGAAPSTSASAFFFPLLSPRRRRHVPAVLPQRAGRARLHPEGTGGAPGGLREGSGGAPRLAPGLTAPRCPRRRRPRPAARPSRRTPPASPPTTASRGTAWSSSAASASCSPSRRGRCSEPGAAPGAPPSLPRNPQPADPALGPGARTRGSPRAAASIQ